MPFVCPAAINKTSLSGGQRKLSHMKNLIFLSAFLFVFLPSVGQRVYICYVFFKGLPSDVKLQEQLLVPVLKCSLNFIALFLLQCILSPPELLVDACVQEPFFQPGTYLSSVPCCSSQASVWKQLHKLCFGICPLIFKPFHHELSNPG